MARDMLRYDRMVEKALRGVVRDALSAACERGLPGNHHFYVTFRTNHPGVAIPDYLRTQYPSEMTIVLQYQFFGLEVDDELFSVTLSFNNVHERLTVPLAAIVAFADPSVNFALQFQALAGEDGAKNTDRKDAVPWRREDQAREDQAKDPGEDDGKRGEVVALDAFRKK